VAEITETPMRKATREAAAENYNHLTCLQHLTEASRSVVILLSMESLHDQKKYNFYIPIFQ
jgi:hypothetical protein